MPFKNCRIFNTDFMERKNGEKSLGCVKTDLRTDPILCGYKSLHKLRHFELLCLDSPSPRM